MKAAFEGDDFERAILVLRTVFPRELDGAFVGLRAGIGEEYPIEAAVLDQRLRKLQAGAVVEGGAWRQQQFGLRGKRFSNGRRRMAERVDGPALHEVEIALARVVPEIGARTADEHHRRASGNLHQRVERMGGVSHVDLLWCWGEKKQAETQEGRTFEGAAFSKTWLKLADQRCRRTRRNPSSLERRRRQARRLVRFSFMAKAHTT